MIVLKKKSNQFDSKLLFYHLMHNAAVYSNISNISKLMLNSSKWIKVEVEGIVTFPMPGVNRSETRTIIMRRNSSAMDIVCRRESSSALPFFDGGCCFSSRCCCRSKSSLAQLVRLNRCSAASRNMSASIRAAHICSSTMSRSYISVRQRTFW